MFLLIIYLPDFMWIGSIPHAFFQPPVLSLANLGADFPNKYFLTGIDVSALASAVCLTVGIRARIATHIFVVLNLIGLSYQYSFGKIDHSILLYCLLGCMSFTNWGTRLCLVPDKARDSSYDNKALSLFAFLLCFAFFSSGFEKAIHWLNFDFSKSGTANWIYSGYYALDRRYLMASVSKSLPFAVLKCLDYCAVVFELSPLLMLLLSRRSWKIWLLAVCIFHLINTLFLNIPFIFNAIVYLVFCDFSFLYESIAGVQLKKLSGIIPASALVLIVSIRLMNIFSGTSSSNIFFPVLFIKANLYLALLVWIAVLAVVIKAVLQNNPIADPPAGKRTFV
ncbi:MAG: hypothetical protein H0X41_04175 [Chitinophagaceae bacterium]|nr:hypothetical protein [Chitinophagaceae bacterium]